ncbi:hypothetical protein OEZ85_004996 [Tetradesmus obliquus]|uniref:Uncharacterized protein n=1 Tax=Tetradesmus obliquus TaxID=3088 RepID=A0ABY8ULY9_TETOB|nr:hypothetical protein OEZ85_004996 [Tetradesmus obliquus]
MRVTAIQGQKLDAGVLVRFPKFSRLIAREASPISLQHRMYVVHVVQAHANVRAKPRGCSTFHTAHGAGRATRHMLHTQSSSSNKEQQIIYMPPLQEQQALLRSSSSNSSSSSSSSKCDIREQLDSLDVLKAALSAEAAEQQRQQQQQQQQV